VTGSSGNVTAHSGSSRKSVTFKRNPRSRSPGTTGHVQAESAVTIARNTQPGSGQLSERGIVGVSRAPCAPIAVVIQVRIEVAGCVVHQVHWVLDLGPIAARATARTLESVKTDAHLGGSKRRRRKTTPAKRPRRTAIIGSRPLKFPMSLRGQTVEVAVVPIVSTATHVNLEVIISRDGKILDWVPTRAELKLIGSAAGSHAELHTTH
jgi:hypothetical protein